jgi:crossover junction endodeoxyribonuclease RuvC
MRIIAIDPGASGALVFGDTRTSPVVIHPARKVPPLSALEDALCGAEPPATCYIEFVGGFIGKPQPGSAMFKFGQGVGFWHGCLAALRVRTILVRPQEWQRGLMGVGKHKGPDRKRALRDEAQRRFPAIKVTLDTADALLIWDYAMRMEGNL